MVILRHSLNLTWFIRVLELAGQQKKQNQSNRVC